MTAAADGPRVYSMRKGAESRRPTRSAWTASRLRQPVRDRPRRRPRNGHRQHEAWWFADEQAALRARAQRDLRGRDLVCWCAPEACHAELLLRFCNA